MIETIKKLDESIKQLQKEIITKQNDIKDIEKAKMILLQTNNICPDCYGKGEIYIEDKSGDPYHKSSDDWHNCSKCNGSGKYNKI